MKTEAHPITAPLALPGGDGLTPILLKTWVLAERTQRRRRIGSDLAAPQAQSDALGTGRARRAPVSR